MASKALESSYSRLNAAFPPPGQAQAQAQVPPDAGYAAPPGAWGQQTGYPPPPAPGQVPQGGGMWAPPGPATWGAPTAERFTANGVFDKLAAMVLLVVVAGAAGALVLPTGIGIIGIFVALGAALLGTFKPQFAKVCTPLYAVAEGLGLGVISAIYADATSASIIPLAIVFTGGVFVGCLVAFRTGLVKVTPKFLVMTMVATLGLCAAGLLTMFVNIPFLSDSSSIDGRSVLFAVIGLGVGVLNLFVDFSFIGEMEKRGAAKEGEWYAVLGLLLSLVLVYLNILRLLARAQRR